LPLRTYAGQVSTRTEDIRRRTIASTVRWIVTGLVALFGAYVCGRAVGIHLDVNPHATEVVAIVVAAAAVWTAARRRR
jgi:hypothetical protein